MAGQMSRRRILGGAGAAALAQFAPAPSGGAALGDIFHMPDEAGPHAATWMAYGATARAWGATGAYGASRAAARGDLMRIAANLSRFEPVRMLVDGAADLAEAQRYLAEAKAAPGPKFAGLHALPPVEAAGAVAFLAHPLDDLWMRDTGPVFVRGADGALHGVNFNFNGWGQADTGAKGWRKDAQKAAHGVADQPIAADRTVADFVLGQAGAAKLTTWLVLEGGGVEVDGEGTAICTESCILNSNRNPGLSKGEVEAELGRLLGVKTVIWLPGVRAKEVTDGHVDFYARFVGAAKVAYALDGDPQSPDFAPTQANARILAAAADAAGRPIEAIALPAPDFAKVQRAVEARNRWGGRGTFNAAGFAAGYVGFYAGAKCVLMGEFGDPSADAAAFAALTSLYPDRALLQFATDGIANGGGTIHCATQQQI